MDLGEVVGRRVVKEDGEVLTFYHYVKKSERGSP
jgi:hypothetical protein